MDFILQGIAQAFVLLAQGDWETYSAVLATVQVSTLSMSASLLIGIPLGYLLGYLDFPGKKPLRTVVDTLLSLPTVFIGLVVYAFLSYRGPFGELGMLFTLSGRGRDLCGGQARHRRARGAARQGGKGRDAAGRSGAARAGRRAGEGRKRRGCTMRPAARLLDRLAWPIMGALAVAGAAYFTLALLGA